MLVKNLDPFGAGPAAHDGFDILDQGDAVRGAVLVGAVALVTRPIPAGPRPRKSAARSGCSGRSPRAAHPGSAATGRGRGSNCRSRCGAGLAAGQQTGGGLERHCEQQRFEQRNFDMCSLTGPLPLIQRRQRSLGKRIVRPAHPLRGSRLSRARPPIRWRASGRSWPGRSSHNRAARGPVRSAQNRRWRRRSDAGLSGWRRFIIDAQAFGHAGPEVLNNNVGIRRQAP